MVSVFHSATMKYVIASRVANDTKPLLTNPLSVRIQYDTKQTPLDIRVRPAGTGQCVSAWVVHHTIQQ